MKTSKLLWKMVKYKPLIFLGNCFFVIAANTLPVLVGVVIKEIFQ